MKKDLRKIMHDSWLLARHGAPRGHGGGEGAIAPREAEQGGLCLPQRLQRGQQYLMGFILQNEM